MKNRIRYRPRHVQPHGAFSECVSEEALRSVLYRLIPTWTNFRVAEALHALRLWGPDARFHSVVDSPFGTKVFTWYELMSIFLDNNVYRRFVADREPILVGYADGIWVRHKSPRPSQNGDLAHVGGLLAVCAELGIKSDTLVRADDRVGSVAMLIESSIDTFEEGGELEWITEAFARYLEDPGSWMGRNQSTYEIADLVGRMTRQPPGTGACHGAHKIYAIIMLLRMDEMERFLPASARSNASAYLRRAAQLLQASQTEEGYWPAGWYAGGGVGGEINTIRDVFDMTGHHLEWIAYSPEPFRPARTSVQKAVDLLIQRLDDVTDVMISFNYGVFSHLGNALLALKGVAPAEAYRLLTT